MISFKVDSRYSQDLEDDFIMNEKLKLYEFIGKDPIRAFYLGYNINDWFEKINKEQKYLYSKQIRHNKDDLEKYQKQIEYWTSKFPSKGLIDMVELSEFIINNMIFEQETEEIDLIKLAFFFGSIIKQNKDENVDSVH